MTLQEAIAEVVGHAKRAHAAAADACILAAANPSRENNADAKKASNAALVAARGWNGRSTTKTVANAADRAELALAAIRGRVQAGRSLTAPCGHNEDLLAVLTNSPCGKCTKKAHKAAQKGLIWCAACNKEHPGRPHSRD